VLPTAKFANRSYPAGSRGAQRRKMREGYLQMTDEQRTEYHITMAEIREVEMQLAQASEGKIDEATDVQPQESDPWGLVMMKTAQLQAAATPGEHERSPSPLPSGWVAEVDEDANVCYYNEDGAHTTEKPFLTRIRDYYEGVEREMAEALATADDCLDRASVLEQSQLQDVGDAGASMVSEPASDFIAASKQYKQLLEVLEQQLQRVSREMDAVDPLQVKLTWGAPEASFERVSKELEDVYVQLQEVRAEYEGKFKAIHQALDKHKAERVEEARARCEAEWDQRVAASLRSRQQRADDIRENWVSIWAKAAQKKPLTLGL